MNVKEYFHPLPCCRPVEMDLLRNDKLYPKMGHLIRVHTPINFFIAESRHSDGIITITAPTIMTQNGGCEQFEHFVGSSNSIISPVNAYLWLGKSLN